MKTITMLVALMIVLCFATSSYAAYCWNSPRIASTAHRLDEEARHFEKILYGIRPFSHIAEDVRDLSGAVRHLHRLAESDASCSHLREDFRTVEREFQHVSHMLRSAHRLHHNGHVMQDWRDVVQSYRQVRDAVYTKSHRGLEGLLDHAFREYGDR